MTHFEYIFVAVAIILSFTLLRLLDALPSVFSRERAYWVHTVWVLFLLFFCAGFWWLNWHNRTLEELTFDYKYEANDDATMRCHCGAPNCREWLY